MGGTPGSLAGTKGLKVSHPRYTLPTAKHLMGVRRLSSNDSAGPEGTNKASWSEPPIPGIQPGMADHAPKQDRWWWGRARCGAAVCGASIFAFFGRVHDTRLAERCSAQETTTREDASPEHQERSI